MPLWHIYHPVGAYSDQDKQDFARDITKIYTNIGLPDFYVVALFHEISESSFFIGGEPTGNTVRVVVEHIARHTQDPHLRRRMTEKLNAVMLPYTRDRGLHWEFHIDETPQDLWMIAGLWPPASGSETEQTWARENEPTPY
ncbi:tautomerase family protein [Nonomuraea sediminis]|uniref:tautomerase family protein n=1 Tax=Nonomuraea sediminis TaxID=2835864 RepID=UPI001BDD8B7E|nr:tautomerase family protein [Nonomuraea sediminis]